jgi:hypothetical protein
MALARFAEEHSPDGASGAQRFFHEADAFNADEAGLRGQSAAQGETKFFEPTVVAAGDRGAGSIRARSTSRFAWGSHLTAA